MKRILSGVRPTGQLHLGNLLGALENWKKIQNEKCFFMIADWHALSSEYANAGMIKNNIFQVAVDFISAGLDPEKSIIFLQSWVPEHAELHLLLSMIVPLPWLKRNPTYKEQLQEVKGRDLATYGFLGYPVLQAADIILYKADTVPVGMDQLPHLELCREIVRRFNYLYKTDILVEPQPLLTRVPKLPGIDGRKMSKSFDNCIYLNDRGKDLEKKILNMFTDPARKRKTDKGHPAICPVFQYHQIFNKKEAEEITALCSQAKIGCVECKRKLLAILEEVLQPIWARREDLEKTPDLIWDILKDGSRQARDTARKTLRQIIKAVGLPEDN